MRFANKEMKWFRAGLRDIWKLIDDGNQVAEVHGKGAWPFTFNAVGNINGKAFQMLLIKKPEHFFSVKIGSESREWGKVWNKSVMDLSPAIVKTFDGRVFEIRDTGFTDKGLTFHVVDEKGLIIAINTYHRDQTREKGIGTFQADNGLRDDDEILAIAMICTMFAALFGPMKYGH